MNILVLAANGRTGVNVVKSAVADGHKVTAFVRREDLNKPFNNSVEVFIGDANSYESVHKAIKSQDIVISTIGHSKNSAKNIQTKTINNIIRAIEETGQNTKIVSLTGTGVRKENDHISFIDKLLNLTISLFDKDRVEDGVNHYNLLKQSSANWVVVRVLKLTNNSPTKYSLTPNGPAKTFVSRIEVANALLEVSMGSKWDKKLPVVSRYE